MDLDVKWFIAALAGNGMVEKDDSIEFFNSFETPPTLEVFAQAVLDQLVDGLPPDQAQTVLEQIQSEIEIAQGEAAEGIVPEIFGGDPPVRRPRVKPPVEPSTAFGGEPEPPAARAEPLIRADGSGLTLPDDYSTWFNNAELAAMEAPMLRTFILAVLEKLRSFGASDLHLSSNARPFMRRSLNVEYLGPEVLPDDLAKAANYGLLTPELRDKFEVEQDLSFGLEVEGERFRIALMQQKDGISGTYRLVPTKIPAIESLGFLPDDINTIERFLDFHNGLILVTGPINSGKTTTLAVLVDYLNTKRKDHIISVEEPIEIVHTAKGCQVTQREIGLHTDSYANALRGALRQDPDIIVVGEMHDLETVEHAISASETGHLVIGTLHTSDAANTLNRVLDVFPPMQQPQIRAMTAGSLRGVICQKLIPAADGSLTLTYELLVNTTGVANLISEGKTYQLAAQMQIGGKLGMRTFDQITLEKFRLGLITHDVAKANLRESGSFAVLQREQAIQEAKKFAAANPKPAK